MNWITFISIISIQLVINPVLGKQLKGDKLSSDEKLNGDKVKKPYQFGYEIEDGQGNMQHRHEHSDGSGAKVGSYGYVDANGIYRKVEYIADDKGFRVKMSSNEPGIKGYNSPSISMVTKPYLGNELETSTLAPIHDGSFNSLEKESSRLAPTKLDNEAKPRHSEPKKYGDKHVPEYLYKRIIPSSKESDEHRANQNRPSLYPNQLMNSPAIESKPSLPLSSDSHYSPPLKPNHGFKSSSEEANSISEEVYRTGHRPTINSFSPLKPSDGKSFESSSEVNNYDSIGKPNHNVPNTIPYSQYDPIKKEKERAQQLKSMKVPYELDHIYHPPAYSKPHYPLPIKKEEDADRSKEGTHFRSPTRWTKHDEDIKKEEVTKNEPIYPRARYHHEPMSKHTSSMYSRNKPFNSNYKDSPSQLPLPPSSLTSYNSYRDPSAGYLATELPLPPPRSTNYDSSHETQLPAPPSSSPPVHSSIYQIDAPSSSPSSHESQDYRDKSPSYFTSSLPPFEPTRLKNQHYSDLLPLPPPQPASSPSLPPPPYSSEIHGTPVQRKRPAAYPPKPETNKDSSGHDSDLPQVIYDSRESGSNERDSHEHHHYPINRNEHRPSPSSHPDHDHDWYSVVSDSHSDRIKNTNKYEPKDEPVYINKLPYGLSKETMDTQTKPSFPLNDYGRLNGPTVNSRYPRDKNSDENVLNRPSRGTSSEIYSTFKTGLRGLFNQISRNKENPYTGSSSKNTNEPNNHINNASFDQYSASSKSSSSLLSSPLPSTETDNKSKKLDLVSSVEDSNHSKQAAPVYRDR
ncbi:uncharacterized protein DDB_G0284459-like [Tetranychus urticae]|uniref:Uncharacterized protein n=1 Tax=Tetranychus urticae TaxID=32264 RepID=T1K8E3_TETUR|nr:uncharacterized protein DDB_G0284459-like [Tetranychus urticae]UVJ89040.1 cuticle protein [Tetranychus cinnabarinus]